MAIRGAMFRMDHHPLEVTAPPTFSPTHGHLFWPSLLCSVFSKAKCHPTSRLQSCDGCMTSWLRSAKQSFGASCLLKTTQNPPAFTRHSRNRLTKQAASSKIKRSPLFLWNLVFRIRNQPQRGSIYVAGMASCQGTGAEMHSSRVQHVGSRGKLRQAATANYLTTAQPDKAINVCTVD